MRVTFHGVRGSTPCESDDIRRYGGNTSCVSLTVPGAPPVLFDMGTGLRYSGLDADADSFHGVCLLSHLHWDHVQGMPFFAPLLCTQATLDIYGPAQADGRSLASVFGSSLCPPMFPVAVDALPAGIRFHDTADGEFDVGPLRVTARMIPHIGPTLGYRVEWNGRSVAYLPDHQQPIDGSLTLAAGARDLIDGVDLLIHDAQYTPAEFARKSTWGHCTIDYALTVASTCGVKRLALFHHDPCRSDDSLDALLVDAVACGRANGVDVFAASEGLAVELT